MSAAGKARQPLGMHNYFTINNHTFARRSRSSTPKQKKNLCSHKQKLDAIRRDLERFIQVLPCRPPVALRDELLRVLLHAIRHVQVVYT